MVVKAGRPIKDYDREGSPAKTQHMDLLIATQMEPASVVPAIRQGASSLDRDAPVYNIATMDHLLDE